MDAPSEVVAMGDPDRMDAVQFGAATRTFFPCFVRLGDRLLYGHLRSFTWSTATARAAAAAASSRYEPTDPAANKSSGGAAVTIDLSDNQGFGTVFYIFIRKFSRASYVCEREKMTRRCESCRSVDLCHPSSPRRSTPVTL